MESNQFSMTALLIEDQPLLARIYRDTLKTQYAQVVHANNRVEAIRHIHQVSADRAFTVALLHERIRCGSDGEQCDGPDVALQLRQRHPETKLLYSIDHLSSYKVGSIIREINPDAILYRPEVTEIEFQTAVQSILKGKSYTSPSVTPHMRNDIVGNTVLDLIDRKILHYLGRGARTKDLPQLVALSLPSIEKRKRWLKRFFDEPANDYQLILAAREKGLI